MKLCMSINIAAGLPYEVEDGAAAAESAIEALAKLHVALRAAGLCGAKYGLTVRVSDFPKMPSEDWWGWLSPRWVGREDVLSPGISEEGRDRLCFNSTDCRECADAVLAYLAARLSRHQPGKHGRARTAKPNAPK